MLGESEHVCVHKIHEAQSELSIIIVGIEQALIVLMIEAYF